MLYLPEAAGVCLDSGSVYILRRYAFGLFIHLRKQAKRHKNAGKKDIWAVGIVYENVQKP